MTDHIAREREMYRLGLRVAARIAQTMALGMESSDKFTKFPSTGPEALRALAKILRDISEEPVDTSCDPRV